MLGFNFIQMLSAGRSDETVQTVWANELSSNAPPVQISHAPLVPHECNKKVEAQACTPRPCEACQLHEL